MNRSKAVLSSLRLANSLLSIRSSSTRPLFTRVTHFFHLSSFTASNQSHTSQFHINTCQKIFFSTSPNSGLELILACDWSDELENKLEEFSPKLTHESVVYVLRKLDKDPQKASAFFNWVCDKKQFRPSSTVYSLMLRNLVNKDSLKQFWVTLRRMKEDHCYIEEETYLSILGVLKKTKKASDLAALNQFHDGMVKEIAMDNVAKTLVDVVLGSDWDDKIGKKLEDMKIELSDNFVLTVLKELRIYPVKALGFFRWVGEHSGYKHNTITYNGILRVLARHESVRDFWNVVEEMKKEGYEMDIDTYIKISRQFQKFRMMEDAVKLFEFMMDGPYKPSVQDCSLLLRSISSINNPDLGLVFRVANKYESLGNSLSKSVYDGIHRALTKLGRFDEAEKIMKAMKNAGFEPDNITYSQVIFGLCKAGRFEDACNVLDEMEENGCIPDIKSWTILIQGHCAANEVDRALLCFAKMMEKNYDADADLLDVLINGFLSQKRVNGAYKLLVEMIEKVRLRPWQATFKTLIEKLLGARRLEEAMNLLRLMKKQNYPPFPEPFVQYISKFGTVEDASEFLKALSVKEYPSSAAYLQVFESFFNEGRHYEAKDLLYKCPHHIRQDSKISLLFGSAKSNKVTIPSRKESTSF